MMRETTNGDMNMTDTIDAIDLTNLKDMPVLSMKQGWDRQTGSNGIQAQNTHIIGYRPKGSEEITIFKGERYGYNGAKNYNLLTNKYQHVISLPICLTDTHLDLPKVGETTNMPKHSNAFWSWVNSHDDVEILLCKWKDDVSNVKESCRHISYNGYGMVQFITKNGKFMGIQPRDYSPALDVVEVIGSMSSYDFDETENVVTHYNIEEGWKDMIYSDKLGKLEELIV
tara:strand:- start:2004 stop:2684 length:681 start_codon:yes stop_codon:yes gene_type:complete